MATNTTNFDLSKPAYSDTADIATINGNMDKVDASLNGLGKGIAIIAKNNTHDAISNGQYVYVHGHGSLAEGLYIATSNIAANAALSASNLTAVSGGLGAQLSSLSNQIANLGTTTTVNFTDGLQTKTVILKKFGSIVCCFIPAIDSKVMPSWGSIDLCTIPEGYRPSTRPRYALIRQDVTSFIPVYFDVNGSDGKLTLNNQGSGSYTTGAILATCLTWNV